MRTDGARGLGRSAAGSRSGGNGQSRMQVMLVQGSSGLMPGDRRRSVMSFLGSCFLAPHTNQDAGVVESLPRRLVILCGVKDAQP